MEPAAAPAPPPPTGLSVIERAAAKQLLGMLWERKESEPFREPVDPVELNIPDYFDTITEPMDLGTVRQRLSAGSYASFAAFKRDINLIFTNCRTYNGDSHPISALANKLASAFEKGIPDAFALAKQTHARELVRPRPAVSEGGSEDEPPYARSPLAAVGNSLKRPLDSTTAAAAAAGAGKKPMARRPSGSLATDELLHMPAARQLGITDADDLVFLQAWKRVVASKQAAAQEAEQQAAALRAALAKEQAGARQLQQQLDELRRKHSQLTQQHNSQQQVLDHQRQLLEQQQVVIREVLARQQAPAAANNEASGSEPQAPAPAQQAPQAGPAASAGTASRSMSPAARPLLQPKQSDEPPPPAPMQAQAFVFPAPVPPVPAAAAAPAGQQQQQQADSSTG